jgi:D-alanine transfer protein
VRAPHLAPALVASLLVAAAVIGGELYARWIEGRYIHALAPRIFDQKINGSALQRAAFRQPDLLPIYGASELADSHGAYHASNLFRDYPTGFTIFPIGKGGTTMLTIPQKLAAIGADLRGKRVVISVTPALFLEPVASAEYYAGSFSRLHAGELAFSGDLSFAVKQAVARRMLEYPKTLEKDALLRFALERLADGSPLSRALYYAALPLGQLQNLVLRLQDHWETLAFIREQGDPAPAVRRQTARLDWSSLLVQAEREYRPHADNNPFGFYNQHWSVLASWELMYRDEEPKQTDQQFLEKLRRSKGWTDLDLVLRALRDLGARPLVLSTPIHGLYHDRLGISYSARQAYYEQLRDAAKSYDVPVLDFADHDGDRYFATDQWGHLSSKGWVHYAQALDAFYHGALR